MTAFDRLVETAAGAFSVNGSILAMAGAGLVGCADFVAGSAARRLPAVVVVATSQAVGVAALLILITANDLWTAPDTHLRQAIAAGGLSSVSLTAFYGALARGPMSLVAPIVSASVAVPVVVGLVGGDRPKLPVLLGLLLIAAGLLSARPRPSAVSPEGGSQAPPISPTAVGTVALTSVAALGFGLTFVLLARAAVAGVPMTVLAFRATSLTLLLPLLLIRGVSARPSTRDLPVLGLVGVADIAASAAYAAATRGGLLTTSAMIYNTYPIATLVLARLVSHERLDRRQQRAVAFTLVGTFLTIRN